MVHPYGLRFGLRSKSLVNTSAIVGFEEAAMMLDGRGGGISSAGGRDATKMQFTLLVGGKLKTPEADGFAESVPTVQHDRTTCKSRGDLGVPNG